MMELEKEKKIKIGYIKSIYIQDLISSIIIETKIRKITSSRKKTIILINFELVIVVKLSTKIVRILEDNSKTSLIRQSSSSSSFETKRLIKMMSNKGNCSWLSPISLAIMFLIINVWQQHRLLVQTQPSLKINDIKLEDDYVQAAAAAAAAASAHHHHRNLFRSKFPVYNVSGLLSVYSIEGIDGHYCNRTYRMYLNQLFLDSCVESMRLLCGGNIVGRRKRNISPFFPESSYFHSKQSSMLTPDTDELSLTMETMDNSDEQQQHAEQILDLIRRTSAISSSASSPSSNPSLELPIIRKRRNHHHHFNQQYSIIAIESQNLMENCCQDSEKLDCRENVLREKFQKICAPNLVTTVEVFRS